MIGILMMSYGAPASIDNVTSYLSHIMHGQKLPQPMLEEAINRYKNMGVADPLGDVTKRQAKALQSEMAKVVHDDIKVYLGFKHCFPFVEDTVEKMIKEGVTEIISLPLTPFYSKTGVEFYQKKLIEKLQIMEVNIPVLHLTNWHLNEQLIHCFKERVEASLSWLPSNVTEDTILLFTAHSQPGKSVDHITYSTQFKELAEAISSAFSLEWKIAYRSIGPKPHLWLGPNALDVINEIALDNKSGIIVCDLLSLTENVEVYYDIHIDCFKRATELGIEFIHTPFLNDSYDFITALCTIVTNSMLYDDRFSRSVKLKDG
ncbi:MAG: ferrochelatase [Bacillaceae bacterium]|nr:ferrochelatase [Bacillaceae bacterium]